MKRDDPGGVPHLGDALSALLDGELSDDAAAEARTHLAACPACRVEMTAVSHVRSLLRDLPPVEPPADFYRRIRTPPAVSLPGPERPPERGAGPPRRRAGLAALAACAAAALVVLGIAAPHDPETSPPVGRFIEAHATAAAGGDPVSQMAPVVVPVSFRR